MTCPYLPQTWQNLLDCFNFFKKVVDFFGFMYYNIYIKKKTGYNVMTKKEMKAMAERILSVGAFKETTGTETVQNNFYTMPLGNLVCVKYKHGKLTDVINYGL